MEFNSIQSATGMGADAFPSSSSQERAGEPLRNPADAAANVYPIIKLNEKFSFDRIAMH